MNTATRVPFLLQQFFTQRLVNQKQVSSHTIASYRDTFQLLLKFVQQQRRRRPSQLTWEDIDLTRGAVSVSRIITPTRELLPEFCRTGIRALISPSPLSGW